MEKLILLAIVLMPLVVFATSIIIRFTNNNANERYLSWVPNGTIRPGNNNSIGNYNIILHNQYNNHATPTIGDSSFEGIPVPQGAEEINPGSGNLEKLIPMMM